MVKWGLFPTLQTHFFSFWYLKTLLSKLKIALRTKCCINKCSHRANMKHFFLLFFSNSGWIFI